MSLSVVAKMETATRSRVCNTQDVDNRGPSDSDYDRGIFLGEDSNLFGFPDLDDEEDLDDSFGSAKDGEALPAVPSPMAGPISNNFP
jgi:hypothetical protein